MGYSNHLWNTGALTPNISVGAMGDYWCEVTYPTGNLVTNGNFSAGNSGFSTDFTYSSFSVNSEGAYTIGTNAAFYHPQFSGTGTGNFLIANAGYQSYINGQWDIWCQTIPVCPGQTYNLLYKARTLTDELPARLQWHMDGVATGPESTLPIFNGIPWQTFSTPWTAGPTQTSVTACLQVMSGDGVGDDFGLDDISIASLVHLRDTIHVNAIPPPTVDLGPDQPLCLGHSVDLDAFFPGATYFWSDGSASPTLHVDMAGTYSVVVHVNGCTNSDQIQLTAVPSPPLDLGNDTTLCAGSVLDLDAFTPGATYLWQDSSSDTTFLVTTPGLYAVRSVLNGCSTEDSVLVSFDPLPVVSLGNDTSICVNASLVLDASVPGASYLWQDGSASPQYPVSGPGTYSVTTTVAGCSASDTLEVMESPMPSVDLGPDTTGCPGASVTFDASTLGATYLWNTGVATPTITASAPGSYAVAVTVNGCSATDTVQLSNFLLPAVDLGPDSSFCAGDQVRIGLSPVGGAYLWSTGESTDSITVSAPGIYWVDAGPFGCAERDSITLLQTPLPLFSLGSDLASCPGMQDTLDATLSGASYLWNTGAASPTLVVGPGSWSVAVTVNGCSASDSVEVAALPAPTVNLGNDTILCPGQTVVLTAFTQGASYAWNDGSTGPSLTASSTGIRSVVLTDSSGCTATDSIAVDFTILPNLDLGNDTAICTGEHLLLSAALPSAGGFLWNQGATTDTLTASTAGQYAVNVSIGQCHVQDTIVLTVLQLPVLSLGYDTLLCPLAQLTLDPASPGVGLVWQDGSTGSDFLVTSTGLYSVTATGANGCQRTDSIQVGYVDPGNFGLGPDTTLCAGNILFLNTGLPSGSTTWSGAVDSMANTLAVSVSGLYIAETSFGTCSLSDSITITFLPLPMLDLGQDLQLCSGSSSQLSPILNNGVSLIWDDGSTVSIRTIDQPGTYWAQASLNGCTTDDTLLVSGLPTPTVDLGADTVLCGNATLLLDVSMPGADYLWNDGVAVGDRSVGGGVWSVQVEVAGCIGTDSISVTALPLPQLDLPADTTLCSGSSWSIDMGQPGASYLWTDGSIAPVLAVDTAGNYGVTVDLAGCTDSAEVVVSYIDLSALDLGADTLLCPGASLPLSVNIPGTSILWQDGSTEPVQTVHSAGTYAVAIGLSGCTAADSIQVSVSSIPTPQLGPDRTLCSGDSLLLQISPGTAQVQWSTGETGPSITVHGTGAYTVTLLQDGCTTSDQMQVDLIPTIHQLDLGPDREVCPGYPVTLDATITGASYTWNTGSHSPVLTTDQAGTYGVQAEGMCIQATDSVVLTDIDCDPGIYIPNAFSPNGDGVNDSFTPSMDEQVRSWTLMIFDRLGSLIHTCTPENASWDGNLSNWPAPPGVYVWMLKYETREGLNTVQRTERGSVTLLR